jgi:DNA-directed RNA polymerase subunit F
MIDFADLIYYTANKKVRNKKEMVNKVTEIVKRIMNKIYPDFPVDSIDLIVKIMFENDLTQFKEILKSNNYPLEALSIVIAIVNHDNSELQKSVLELAKRFLPVKTYTLLYSLNKLAHKNVYGNNELLEKILGFSSPISIELLYAIYSEDEETVRHAALEGIKKFCKRTKIGVDPERIEKLYLGLSSIVSSNVVDLPALAANSIVAVPIKEAEILYKATQGNISALYYI